MSRFKEAQKSFLKAEKVCTSYQQQLLQCEESGVGGETGVELRLDIITAMGK